MILLIDNYDSFVHNLARYIGRLGVERRVVRHDAITLDDISSLAPTGIVLSPGPCTPAQSGICMDLIRHFHERIPILGVCLGHQCIGEIFGGRTIRAPQPVHGRASMVEHNAEGLFKGLPNPLEVGRYHSLITELAANSPLEITARTEQDDIIMALRHISSPLSSVHFHPESILTPYGLDIMRNFVMDAMNWHHTQTTRKQG